MAAAVRLLLATANAGKVREFESLLGAHCAEKLEVLSLASVGPVDFPEEGDEYRPNAVAKALAAARTHRIPALADDSGLEVAALSGEPGPHSARYGGPGLDDAGRVDRLLVALAELGPGIDRSARFVCWAALAMPSGIVELRFGECRGRILEAPAAPVGPGGFGYDPVFEVSAEDADVAQVARGRAMAQLSEVEKNRVSHRGRAVEAMLPVLLERLVGPRPC